MIHKTGSPFFKFAQKFLSILIFHDIPNPPGKRRDHANDIIGHVVLHPPFSIVIITEVQIAFLDFAVPVAGLVLQPFAGGPVVGAVDDFPAVKKTPAPSSRKQRTAAQMLMASFGPFWFWGGGEKPAGRWRRLARL